MPPGRGRHSESVEPQGLYELGKLGRQTGRALPDSHVRDEFGMQPLADLDMSEDESGSDDMDLESSAGDGPRTVLKKHFDRLSLPRSRSPKKTNLGSPARRNPHLAAAADPADEPTVTRKLNFGKASSQSRSKPNGVNGSFYHVEEEGEEEEVDEEPEIEEEEEEEEEDDTQNTVVRHDNPEDDDNTDLLEESIQMVAAMGGDTPSPEPEAPPAAQPEDDDDDDEPIVRQAPAKKKGRGRPKAAPQKPVVVEEEEEEEDPPEEEPSAVEETPRNDEDSQLSLPKRRGRPAKKTVPKPKEVAVVAPAKSRKRSSAELSIEEHSMGSEDEEDVAEPAPQPEPKRQRVGAKSKPTKPVARPAPAPAKTAPAKPAPRAAPVAKTAAAPAPAEPKPRGRPGRKPKDHQAAAAQGSKDVGETSFAALQRGPPLPKSRGLVSTHRDADAVTTTRSGRQSHRPLSFWRGEQITYEYEEREDHFTHKRFAVPTNKGITRPPRSPSPPARRPPHRTKGRPKGKSSSASRASHQPPPEEELEDWEVGPGTIEGDLAVWEPEHEFAPPADDEDVEVVVGEIAHAGVAIDAREARDGLFRYAKVMSTPFMGAGVVELPPGAEKRPKNSRKMHMVFFVQYGKVLVSVNETQFRISAGGMWVVPRGNYYTMNNDYDVPCRVFFAQARELAPQPTAQPVDPDMSQNSTLALV